jgi:hypothetical protein
MALAAPTSISVRSAMRFFTACTCALLGLASPLKSEARSEPVLTPMVTAPRMCVAAAQSVRDWGWTETTGPRAPLSAIVSAVNQRLRINAGRLSAADVARLKKNTASDDACTREVSTAILRIQDESAARAPRPRLAVVETPKSVTRWLEKQSPTREAISP